MAAMCEGQHRAGLQYLIWPCSMLVKDDVFGCDLELERSVATVGETDSHVVSSNNSSAMTCPPRV